MMMAENLEDKASGDIGSERKIPSPEPEPVPVKVPDVELVVDGFGFMPKSPESSRSSLKPRKASKSSREGTSPEYHSSPCASSSNIDIVRRFTWKTKNRMTVQVISYGATITSIQVPDKKGVPDDVVAGFDTLEGTLFRFLPAGGNLLFGQFPKIFVRVNTEYFQPRNPYFGATIGRYANCIGGATMSVRPGGRVYMLSANRGQDHCNGGFVGFDKVNWRTHVVGNKVYMCHVSERFHEGYPGTLMVRLCFEVTCDNTIHIEMKCTTTEPTIINLSNAPYFNLAGHHQGSESMYEHIFTINADKYTQFDDEGLITGEKKVVGGTPYDFRVPRLLKAVLQKIPMGGYDVNFCITQGTAQDLTFHSRALHPGTGRVLEVYSNQPGLQFYTGNRLPDPEKIVEPLPGDANAEEDKNSHSESDDDVIGEGEANGEEESVADSEGIERYGYVPLNGKGGTFYKKHGLFCLLPQNYPDAINHKNFPNCVLNPEEEYVHRIQYKFGILLGKYV